MKNKDFCHIHLHTEFSTLDGFGSAEAYIKKAFELGFKAIALTDHGNVDGAIDWQKECEKQGLSPIIGCELYIVPDMHKKTKGEKRGHLTVSVENINGWHTLCQWLTKANLEGFYHRPRIDFDTIISSDLDGLFFSTACAGSFLFLPGGDEFLYDLDDKAPDHVFCEIMPHEIKRQHELHDLIKKEYSDFPLLATNDCHYINKDDWEAQEVLLAIQSNSKWDDPNRWAFGIKDLHLRTADEMMLAFRQQGDFTRKEIKEAMANTMIIADACKDFRIEQQDISLPELPYEVLASSEQEELSDLCFESLKKLGLNRNKKYYDRLKTELKVIEKKGFARYFLIVKDFIYYCKSKGWGIGPARGSVGGSLIAHLIGITEGLDPIKYGLLFSRFISEDRADYPDIDIDVEKRYRQQAVDYLYETYGENNVCAISTNMRMKSKAVIRDIGRVFEVPGYDVSAMANSIWEGEHIEGSAIKRAIEKTKEAKEFADNYPREIDFALQLEGQLKARGRHAAGIIVSGEDLTKGTKCVLVNRSKTVTANWTMDNCEYSGLMKLDVLGLATMSVLKECESLINERECTNFYYHEGSECYFYSDKYPGQKCDEVGIKLECIQPDNKETKVFDLIKQGKTAGIFQVAAKPLTELCMEMEIDCFDDLVAALALVRPGPAESGMTTQYIERKKGKEYDKIHPLYEEITKDTYGITCYQEQVMKTFTMIAGMSETEADKIRKVIGKKRDPKEFEPYKDKFINGCKKQKTFSKRQAVDFWEGLLRFARYAFNRAHSTAYALIAYRTAWLKAHYPAEFMCATMTYGEYNEKSRDPNKHKQYVVDEIIESGLYIMPPKIGISDPIRWIAKDKTLYAPFIEIKGIGENNAIKCCELKKAKKVKQKGFFNIEPVQKKQTKIDIILDEIQANDKDAIPKNLSDYLSFKIKPKRNKKPFIPKAKKIRYRNEDILNCKKCSLRREATEPVLSSTGIYNVMVILEAPGEQEDKGIKSRNGKIIRAGAIGPAGKRLWKELDKYEIERKQLHVSNVCRCFPSKSKMPNNDHIKACTPWLLDEIKKLDCKLILACGNTCVKAFTGKSGGINSLSGKKEWVDKLNAFVIWCNHPSSVLRNSKLNGPIFEKGIKAFAKEFKGMIR